VPSLVGGADRLIERARDVIVTEADALRSLADVLDHHFVAACYAVLCVRRQLVVTGMGKSGHIARKIAATFAATGTPAIFVHPAEAAHGDLGMMVAGDVLLVLSNSGNTAELRAVLAFARQAGITVIGVASRRKSLVMDMADITIVLPQMREACSANVAPTTSTTMQLALGDALAMAVMDLRGISKNHLRSLHPAGAIGLALTPVADIMHGLERLPVVHREASMPQAISVMTAGCFGVAGVVDGANCLVGLITDGDLRRHFTELPCAFAHEVMTPAPKVIAADMLAADALQFLNDNQITAAFVVEDSALGPQPPLGIVHIHDLLRLGLS